MFFRAERRSWRRGEPSYGFRSGPQCLSTDSMPLGEFDRNILRPAQENELAVVEIHHPVAELDASGRQPRDFGLTPVMR